jgi:hypothetical protein
MGIDPAARRIEMNQFQEAIAAATKAKSAIERLRREAINAATDAINTEYSERVDAASEVLWKAEKAARDNIDATAAHPWDGRRVVLVKPKYARYGGHLTGHETLHGIVEVVRQSSDFPANMRWSRPTLGKVIIRKVKKDGTPSLQFYDWGDGKIENWSLPE